MNKYTSIVFYFCLLYGSTSFAQQFGKNPEHSLDTIRVKGNRFCFIGDHAYYIHKDTILVLPDTVEFYIRKNNMQRTDKFYNQVETKMSKHKASSLIYDFLFKSAQAHQPHNEESSEQRFTPFESESIKNIDYKFLKIFGSDINDTTINSPSKWAKPLNKIHIHTRKWVVKKNILFNHEEKIDPNVLVDTERLLRKLDYIKDARIFVHDHKKNKTADLVVATKDVFPYNFLVRPNNNNNALFGVSNINIAGIGHEVEYNNIKDGGSDFFYRVRNIEGTFIDSEVNYANHFIRTGYGIFLTKDFQTQDTKYAGGASFSQYEFGEFDFNPISDITSTFTYGRKYRDLWAARAFNTSFVSNFLGLKENTKAVASARIEYSDFFDRPTDAADTNFRYHDHTNFLLSLGLTSRIYYKDKFILQYGRTEDIPTGSAVGVVLGRQKGEFRNRMYLGFTYARGGYIKHFGYLNTLLSIGSFISEEVFNDGVFKISADYFTKLFTFNQFKFRQFIDISFAQAIDPSEEVILRTQNDLGIRGISGYYHHSTTKFNIKVESLLFTPASIMGFRLALFGFLDYTVTDNIRNPFFNKDSFLGVGGGIRLRNDNLAFSTIQLRVGFYPSLPINGANNWINVATSASLNIRDFDFKAPEVIPFR